ncbi:MAG: tRNA dihydrouridine synthase DusB [Simkaniaceae bacterium]
MKYIRPIQLGRLQLSNNIFYSPLAGCSDYSYRKIAAHRYRPGLFYCEMVKMEALVRYDQNTFHLLDYDKDMHPIGAQLCGSNPKIAGQAAKIIESLGFDVVDLNCGCPVDKVTKDGSGSGMLKNPERIGEILANMAAAVSIPVTVKIRAGWDEASINAPAITSIAEEAGAQAIAIHGRTRKQGYKGNADWSHIQECKKKAKKIKIIGNGDIFTAENAKNMFLETGCDAILVSRGTLGKPWIAKEIAESLNDQDTVFSLTPAEIKNYLLRHIHYIMNYQSSKNALLDIRKVGCWYLRDGRGTKALRQAINHAKTIQEALNIIHDYPWDETSF